MQIGASFDKSSLKSAIQALKNELEDGGDVIHVTETKNSISISIQYSFVDYKRSEFTQVQVRDGVIEFIKEDNDYLVRSTQNEYISDVRDSLIKSIESVLEQELIIKTISLFDVPDPKLRSRFFHELATDLSGYSRKDVSDVHVYKPKPTIDDEDDENDSNNDIHIEKVSLKGSEVTRSQILNDLLDNDDYYIIKIRWTSAESLKRGYVYDIEAVFDDPKDCAKFSFMLKGVFERVDGVLSARKRAPNKSEIEDISKVIEVKARELAESIRNEYLSGENDEL